MSINDETIPPRREMRRVDFDNEQTMPGKRDRKQDGRFVPGDLILNRYRVIAELGQGGMGVVYQCLDETAGIEVALKALPPELSHNTLEMEDIRENFQLVAGLIHQNIAVSRNLEKDNSSGNYYLIMECVKGEDLRRWIKRKRKGGSLTLEAVLPSIRQVADALDYAHRQKVIHRDIKPGNIMIAPDGTVKVLDFGLAAQIHTSMTRVSMAYHGTSGTGPYMAPEQWRGRAQGANADQYALAVMTYEMLAGHLPFESADAAVLREAVLNDTAEELREIPRYAQEALKRAMSKEPAERFESCSAFVEALGGGLISEKNEKNTNSLEWRIAIGLAATLIIIFATVSISLFSRSTILSGYEISVDENKTPEEIRQEIATWDAAKIQNVLEEYIIVVDRKTNELSAKTDELKEIPLTEMFGDKAKGIKDDIAKITKSLDKLKNNMIVYAEGLKRKSENQNHRLSR